MGVTPNRLRADGYFASSEETTEAERKKRQETLRNRERSKTIGLLRK